jgi:hypothetical protein
VRTTRDAALHQPPRHQRLACEIVCRRFADAIQLLRRLGLLAGVDRLWRRRLHPVRQLVGVNAGGELGIERVLRRVLLVQLVQQPQPSPLLVVGPRHRRLEVDDRAAGIPDRHPVVGRRHVAVAPVRRPVDRTAAMIGEDDETGQVLVLAAEAVSDPAADARVPGEDAAGVHLEDGRAVRRAERVHRADERDVRVKAAFFMRP